MRTTNKTRKIGIFTIVLFFGFLGLWPNLLVEGSLSVTINDIATDPSQEKITLLEALNQEEEPYYISNNTFFASVNTPVLIQVRRVFATAYSSTHDQTDEDPFITASGAQVYDGVIAANFLPFGAKVKIPEIFGDKIFTVEDRMNERFGDDRIDIWFSDRQSAQNFGIKTTLVEILE
jgi:3D (Asp-Asp-Asp) domain-containing protein